MPLDAAGAKPRDGRGDCAAIVESEKPWEKQGRKSGCHDTRDARFLKVSRGFQSATNDEAKCQNLRHFPMFSALPESVPDITDSFFSPSLYQLSYLSLPRVRRGSVNVKQRADGVNLSGGNELPLSIQSIGARAGVSTHLSLAWIRFLWFRHFGNEFLDCKYLWRFLLGTFVS